MMDLFPLPTELIYAISIRLNSDDIMSLSEAYPHLYEICIQCLRKHCKNLKLCRSCESGNISRVRLLLQGGANPNEKKNKACLTKAVAHGHEYIVKLLLENGA